MLPKNIWPEYMAQTAKYNEHQSQKRVHKLFPLKLILTWSKKQGCVMKLQNKCDSKWKVANPWICQILTLLSQYRYFRKRVKLLLQEPKTTPEHFARPSLPIYSPIVFFSCLIFSIDCPCTLSSGYLLFLHRPVSPHTCPDYQFRRRLFCFLNVNNSAGD